MKRSFASLVVLALSLGVGWSSVPQSEPGAESPDLPTVDVREIPGRGYRVELRRTALDEALLEVARLAGVSLVVEGDFSQPVSLTVEGATLRDILREIAESFGMEFRDGRLLRVLPKAAQASEEEGVAETYRVRRVPLEDLDPELRGLLSPGGRMAVNAETGTVFVLDSPRVHELVREFLRAVEEGTAAPESASRRRSSEDPSVTSGRPTEISAVTLEGIFASKDPPRVPPLAIVNGTLVSEGDTILGGRLRIASILSDRIVCYTDRGQQVVVELQPVSESSAEEK